MRFQGKTAIVTGAGGGIGEAYARGVAREGASVVIGDLNEEGAEEVAASIRDSGRSAMAVKVDVADPASADAMAKATIAEFGGIDLLVNNAAIYGGMQLNTLMSVDLDYYNRFMSVNMNGALHVTRACVDSMTSRGGGVIVNQSSTAAYMAGGFYSIAKAALNALTISMATELGSKNIRVNAIAPGPTDTKATRSVVGDYAEQLVKGLPLKRLGQPEDHVGMLLFLLSDDASWITGQIYCVDGGQTVRL